MNNADAIRNMKDTELYNFLNKGGFCPKQGGCYYDEPNCSKCLKKWIKKEALPTGRQQLVIYYKFY